MCIIHIEHFGIAQPLHGVILKHITKFIVVKLISSHISYDNCLVLMYIWGLLWNAVTQGKFIEIHYY